MSKKINLHIAEPCHENWDNMTPVQQGKFCGSCQKQVVDFTGMSDRQVAEFFKKPSTGSVCGRFMTDQLERDIEIPRKRIPWIKYFFSIALPAFFLSKASAQKMGKPVLTERKDTAVTPSVTPYNRILGMVAPSTIVPVETDKVPVKNNGLKVWIVDANTGLPIEGATVILNTSAGKPVVITDQEGMVTLDIYRKQTFHGIEISAAGYAGKTVSYGAFKKDTDGRILFRLDKLPALKDDVLMGDVDSIPVCTVRMGAVAYPVVEKIIKGQVKGVVENENGERIPFATISAGKKGEIIIADENGEFLIKKDWLKKGKSIEVSSAGFTGITIQAGSETYRDGSMLVQLKPVMLDEVVITSMGAVISCRRTMGQVTRVVGEVINTQKNTSTTTEETIPSMEESPLQVYPNPVGARGTVHIGFKQPIEGYYDMQLISLSGQLVKKQELWLDAEARLLDIELPAVTAGTYILTLTNRKSGKKYTNKLLVQ